LFILNKINKYFQSLVVTYYGSAIDRSKKQPVFQIIMEYVDGLVDLEKKQRIIKIFILLRFLGVVYLNIFPNLDNFKNLLLEIILDNF